MDSPHKAKVAAEKDLAIASQLIEETGARIYEPALKRVSEQKSDIRLFFHTALTREAARSRPARLKWSHLLNTSATTLRRYSLNILKELGKV